MGWVGGTIYVCLWAALLVAIVFQYCGYVVESCVEEERIGLLQIKAHMKLYAYDNDYNNNGKVKTWFGNGETDDCCEWPELDYNSFEIGYISVSTLTSLRTLTLSGNHLNDSSFLSQGFCKLRNLEHLKLGSNSIKGGMLSCLQNLSSLQLLDLSSNQLTGTLPSTLSNITSLHVLDISDNNFVGKWSLISLSNHSKLQVLRLSRNKLEVQTEDSPWQPMFRLQSLSLEKCSLNKHDGTIPNFLFHQHNLKDIDLSHNNLIGPFPTWFLSNNSNLTALNLLNNAIAEHLLLPPFALSSLVSLDISRNNFQGNLPENIGVIFLELKLFNISGNHFEGHIPTSVGEMGLLRYADFSDNNFLGEVLRKIFSHCSSLVTPQLSDNNLQGDIIPEDIWLPMLTWLKLSNNHFGGTIKEALQISTFLNYLDISSNTVIGELPPWIGYFWPSTSSSYDDNMPFMNYKYNGKREEVEFLEKNQYLPYSGGVLVLIPFLQLPEWRNTPKLVMLTFLVGFNVSYNNLTGRVPKGGQLADFDERNYFGNPRLYGYSKSYINTTLPPDDPSNRGGGDQDDDEETYMVDFWWSFRMSCDKLLYDTLKISKKLSSTSSEGTCPLKWLKEWSKLSTCLRLENRLGMGPDKMLSSVSKKEQLDNAFGIGPVRLLPCKCRKLNGHTFEQGIDPEVIL
ncbi:Receptor-like protein 15 [Bienertia sinuspersici]